MAENDDSQERTEQPTAKRIREAREKGQVPRSKELVMTVVMLVGATFLLFAGGRYVERLAGVMHRGFTIDREWLFDETRILPYLAQQLLDGVVTVAPALIVLLIAVLLTPSLMGGWNISLKAIAPKLEKLNPLKGLKRVFGPNGLMELVKAMGKFLLVGAAGALLIWTMSDRFFELALMPTRPAMASAVQLLLIALILLSASLILIAAIDIPFQLHRHFKQLRMTRKEVRDEQKETEGQPEVKSKQRNLQYEIASRRMMDAVPNADVVITNPTHYAVALSYDPETMAAPVVVAMGMDHVAATIRRIATESNVPLLEAPPLARALYAGSEIGQPIPAGLYVAVAEVMAWIYQLRNAGPNGPPGPPPNPEV